ncbi:hypothetical protein LP116_00940 [Moraxella bovis]|nr:virulence factor TspB C-terminal domain-related protein [Moraxella bovis]UZA59864.1 hypothetical protein LP116_00940 [Moraxella bovis]
MVISAMALDLSDIFGDMFGIIIPKNAGIHYYKQGYTVYSPENEILDPAKPDTKPETQPETKPQPKPVPSPETQPQPKPVPSPNPQDRPLPPKVNPIGVEEKKPDEANPADEKPFELPEFCKWASWFCEGDIDKKDTDIDIDEMPIPTNSVNISFGGSCPTPKNFSFSIGGRSMVFSMSFDPICRIATSFGGIVKIISTIIAAYILTGIKS